MKSVNIKNTTYRLDFSFLVFNALVFLMRENNTVMTFYAVCILHELGHLFAIAVTGGKVKSVVFSGTGVIITPERNSRHELFIMLAGAGTNLTAFFLTSLSGIGGMFRLLNLCTAIYNLLPYRQLDGGAALGLLIDGTPHERIITNILTSIKILFSCILFVTAVFYNNEFVSVFIMSVMLLISERGT